MKNQRKNFFEIFFNSKKIILWQALPLLSETSEKWERWRRMKKLWTFMNFNIFLCKKIHKKCVHSSVFMVHYSYFPLNERARTSKKTFPNKNTNYWRKFFIISLLSSHNSPFGLVRVPKIFFEFMGWPYVVNSKK